MAAARLLLLASILQFAGCAAAAAVFPAGRWIDLTHCFDESAVYWPTNEPFKHEAVYSGINEKGYYYSSYRFSAEEHGGTHLDAPVHFARRGKSVEQIPPEKFVGPAAVINIAKSAARNRDYQVQRADIERWEKNHGRIPDGAIVLLHTGFASLWPDRLFYTGTDKTGPQAVRELSFPGLHPDAARWLAEERRITAVGIDTPSIDYGRSSMFESHRVLSANGITVYENVAALSKLPEKGAFIVALPMKIRGGSGAPLRIVGFIPAKR